MGPRKSVITWIVLALIAWALILIPISGCVSANIEAVTCDDIAKPDCTPPRKIEVE